MYNRDERLRYTQLILEYTSIQNSMCIFEIDSALGLFSVKLLREDYLKALDNLCKLECCKNCMKVWVFGIEPTDTLYIMILRTVEFVVNFSLGVIYYKAL